MTSKTMEILDRIKDFRNRGISREMAGATLGSQYHYLSIEAAARAVRPDMEHTTRLSTLTETIIASVYGEKNAETESTAV